jgi:hypothetical protein
VEIRKFLKIYTRKAEDRVEKRKREKEEDEEEEEIKKEGERGKKETRKHHSPWRCQTPLELGLIAECGPL